MEAAFHPLPGKPRHGAHARTGSWCRLASSIALANLRRQRGWRRARRHNAKAGSIVRHLAERPSQNWAVSSDTSTQSLLVDILGLGCGL